MNTPKGYLMDAKGRLVPEASVSDLDKLRTDVVMRIVEATKRVREHVAEYRVTSLEDLAAFEALSLEKYGVKPRRGKGGSLTLNTFDGRYRIVVERDEKVTFNEQVEAARALIRECIDEWTQQSGQHLRALVDAAFEVGKSGQLSVTKVLGLRKAPIDDPRWLRAMDALSDALQVVGSATYLRVYVRGENDAYHHLSLDGLAPAETAACNKAHACRVHAWCGDEPCPQCARTLPLPLGGAEGGAS